MYVCGNTPSIPNLEVIHPPCITNFMRNRTSISYKIKNNFIQEYSCILKIVPPDGDKEVENCMTNELGHMTSIGPIRSFKIKNCHVTQQGKQN